MQEGNAKSREKSNNSHSHENISFALDPYTPNIQECKFLLLKVIEHAVRDYSTLYSSKTRKTIEIWKQARDFIFNDDYYILWGDLEMNMEDMLDILDLNIDALRSSARKKLDESKRQNGERLNRSQ